MSTLARCLPVLILVPLAACSDADPVAPGPDQPLALEGHHVDDDDGDDDDTSMAPVVTFADPDGDPVGRSWLERDDDEVEVRVRTSGLEPGNVVTLWWVVFNDRAACDGPCDDGDLTDPDVKVDILYADGRIVRGNGRVTLRAELEENDITGSVNEGLLGLPPVGLLDAEDAEIHVVVRDHGPRIPGLIRLMRTTFGGGCAGVPPELGGGGPNVCADLQFAVHQPS